MSETESSAETVINLYENGNSITEIYESTGVPRSTIRFRLKRLNKLRTPKEGILLAAKKGRMSRNSGKRRPHSEKTKEIMRASRLKWAEKNAKGTTVKPTGYLEYTRGPLKGKSVHVAAMEARLGRLLKPDECVHHIDGNRSNNAENNLALCTRSGHSRLHRFEDQISGIHRERDANGRFS